MIPITFLLNLINKYLKNKSLKKHSLESKKVNSALIKKLKKLKSNNYIEHTDLLKKGGSKTKKQMLAHFSM